MASTAAQSRVLGHYRLLEKIGSGGMGEVYRAHDEHLDRDVAVKVLTPGEPESRGSDTPTRHSLQQEAHALSRLNHPNIATVYDFDREGDLDFIVMEYIEGESLAEKIKTQPIAERQLLDIAFQTLKGLAAAHERGIVHRDLKPANLQITLERRVKILDFGLARLVHTVDVTTSTTTVDDNALGITGTLAYMAPEQLRGEMADARSDLWSMGVVLYQMATGELPFQGKTATAMADAILHQQAPGIANGKASPGLQAMVAKCLQKEPGRRYQSADELLRDLRSLASEDEPSGIKAARKGLPRAARKGLPRAARRGWVIGLVLAAIVLAIGAGYWIWRSQRVAAWDIHSVAVLPLLNLSNDPAEDYFSEGMTDAIINELSRASTLKVISRTSAMRYKDSTMPMNEIARQLHVDGVIEGSVFREGNQVRINVQLIDGSTGTQVWADSFERDMHDVLALQSEIAHAIMRQLRVRLGDDSTAPIAARVSPEAYDRLLKARFYTYRITAEDNAKAEQYAREAIGLQPDLGDAYHILSEILYYQGMTLGSPTVEEARRLLDESLAAAEKAIALGANAHSTYALLRFTLDHDPKLAEAEYKRSIELQPNRSSVHGHYGVFLSMMGRCTEARNELLRAVELDPTGEFALSIAGEFLIYCKDLQSGEQYLRAALEIDPNYERARRLLEMDYLLQHKTAEMLQMIGKSGRSNEEKAEVRRVLETSGETGYRQWVLQRVMRDPRQNQRAINLSSAYALAGEREKALDYLEKAYEERDPRLGWVRAFPQYWFLWGDARYNAVLANLGLPKT